MFSSSLLPLLLFVCLYYYSLFISPQNSLCFCVSKGREGGREEGEGGGEGREEGERGKGRGEGKGGREGKGERGKKKGGK